MPKKVSAKGGGVGCTFRQSQTTIKKLIKPRLPKKLFGHKQKTQKQIDPVPAFAGPVCIKLTNWYIQANKQVQTTTQTWRTHMPQSNQNHVLGMCAYIVYAMYAIHSKVAVYNKCSTYDMYNM